jgi:hypothetical protein
MASVVVDLYLARHRARVEILTGNFQRLSDYLNSSPTAYLSGVTQLISDLTDLAPGAWVPSAREMVAPLSEVRFIDPIVESAPPGPRTELLRERVQVNVELELDAWRVTGVLYLVDRVRWTDYLISVRGKFVPLSRASAALPDSRSPVERDLLLINGSRISALYADPL